MKIVMEKSNNQHFINTLTKSVNLFESFGIKNNYLQISKKVKSKRVLKRCKPKKWHGRLQIP